mgnify:CR=1 FL=1
MNLAIVKRGARVERYGPGATTHPAFLKTVLAARIKDATCLQERCRHVLQLSETASVDLNKLLDLVKPALYDEDHGRGLNDYMQEILTWGHACTDSLSRACAILKELVTKLETIVATSCAQEEERDKASVNQDVQLANVLIQCLNEHQKMRPFVPNWAEQAVMDHVNLALTSLQHVTEVELFAVVGLFKDSKDPFQKWTVCETVTWKFGSGDPIPQAWRGDNI